MSKISELTDGGSLLPTDTLIAVRSGANVKVVNDTINVTTLNPDQINMGDNEQIRLGNSQDLLIYHDGSNSLIQDAGTGDLILKSNGNATVIKTNAGNNLLSARDAGSVGIFYDGSEKLTTTSTGIDVTGSVTADALTISQNGATTVTFGEQGGGDSTTLNLGKGFDSESAIWFQGASNWGGLVMPSNENIVISLDEDDAVVADRSFLVQGSGRTKTHLSVSESGDISFYDSAGSSQSFFWDASAESLGIGTTSPAQALSVESSSVGVTRVSITNTGNASAGAGVQLVTKNGATQVSNATLRTDNAGNFSIFTGTTGEAERMRIDDSGQVGIGASPSYQLDVIGTTEKLYARIGDSTNNSFTTTTPVLRLSGDSANNNAGPGLSFYAGVTTAEIYGTRQGAGSDGDLRFHTRISGTVAERMRIDSSGNVGIGTASPATELHVVGSSGDSRITVEAPASQNTWLAFRNTGGADAYLIGYDPSASAFRFYDDVANTERMRIDASGNLLVGCTSQPDASNFGGFINPVGQFRSSRNSTSAATQFSFNNPNGEVGTIVTSGSATAYNTSSDQRLKENIVDAPSASDDIDAIQVRSFDWKADGSHQKYGMVAQELQTVAPEAVSAPDDPEKMMGVDYSKLVPMLIKEVQQLRARVAQLEGAN